MKRGLLIFCCVQAGLQAQEAASGFELGATLSGQAAYSHEHESDPLTGGFRAVLYPTWKLDDHWAVSGAIQISSRPYFFEQFQIPGYGAKTDILQAHLSYSKFWKDRSVIVRLGQLSSAFGSFLLRYDDAVNPLIDMPMAYGYYYKPVSTRGLTGAQVDATVGKLDMRAQFLNSSPANPRSVFDRDQYGSWAGGAGYTIRQGLRVGVSAYRGPYLDRTYRYYFPGEAKPRDLPGSGYGIDVEWAGGHWNVYGELQRFQMVYRAIPTLNQHTGYAEARRVLHPRWYVAARAGYQHSVFDSYKAYEGVVGFRPNRYQLVKVGYQVLRDPDVRGTLANTLAVQFVTSFRAISIARD
jgi:hypothetical protein